MASIPLLGKEILGTLLVSAFLEKKKKN